MIRAVVFDLDGVVRLWDQAETTAIEHRFGLPNGVIREAAFDPVFDHEVVVGAITDEQWRHGIAATLAEAHGPAAFEAVAAWAARTGSVDAAVLDCVSSVRRHRTVALLTNATTRLDQDLVALGLDDSFDRIFNSSSIGVAKPDAAVFEHVGAQLSLSPTEWLFVDDRAENVEGCRSFGVDSHQFSDLATLRAWLDARLAPWGGPTPPVTRADSAPPIRDTP